MLKGLVLAGGKGSRLRPFTYSGAKQLVPVANKPVLFYALEQLAEAGISEIGIVVGETGAEVRRAAGDGSRFGLRLTYLEQPQPLGIAHAIAVARDFLASDPFVLYLGDNFVLGGVVAEIDAFRASGAAAQVLLTPVERPQEFGVAVVEGERLLRVVEKPAEPPSRLVVTGIYCFTPAVHAVIAGLRPSARGEFEITEAIQGLLDRGLPVVARRLTRPWIDTGRMGDVLAANRLVLQTLAADLQGRVDTASRLTGAVVLGREAQVIDSVIEGPCIIGERARIEHARLRPFTSIGADVLVRDSEIGGSVVLECAQIDGAGRPIVESLIGRHVHISGADRAMPAYRLVLGDHSEASLP